MPTSIPYLRTLLLSLSLLMLLPSGRPANGAPIYSYKIVAKYPHSTSNYTEGFFYLDGMFYEGTGLTGHSAVMATDPTTGNTIKHREIQPQYFGEGIL